MINTLYKEKNGYFKTKSIEIIIAAHLDNNSSKKLGIVELNLSDYCNAPVTDQMFSLKDCFDKNARLWISVSAKVMNEGVFTDNISDISRPSLTQGTDEYMTGSLFSDDSERIRHTGKNLTCQEFTNQSKELKEKINDLEKLIENLTTEKNTLKVQLGIAYEKSKIERDEVMEHIKELDRKLQEQGKCNFENIEKSNLRKEKIRTLKNEMWILKEKITEYENSEIEIAVLEQRYKSKKQSLKRRIRDLLQDVQSNSEEITQIKLENRDLKSQLRSSTDLQRSKTLGIDTPESHSRKHTDTIGNLYKGQLKSQIQLLEDKKEEALSKQTELVLEIQRNKASLLIAEEKYKQDISKLEAEIFELKQEKNEFIQNTQHTGPKSRQSRLLIDKDIKKYKINTIFKNFQELENRKDETENESKEYEVQFYQKYAQSENDSYNFQDFQNKIKMYEKNAASMKIQIQLKDKELEENLKNNESLLIEISKLKSQMKLFTESEFSDTPTKLLQEQLITCEKNLAEAKLELKIEQVQNSEQISQILGQLVKVKSTLQESEDFYVNKINQLTFEKEMLHQQINGNPFCQPRKSTSELVHLAQEENFNQTIQLLRLEVSELNNRLKLVQDKNQIIEAKLGKRKTKIMGLKEDKRKYQKKFRESQEMLRILSTKINNYEVKIYEINEEYIKYFEYSKELEIEIQNLKSKQFSE